MSATVHQLRDLSTLFTRSEVQRWQKEDFDSIRIKLKRYDLYEKYRGVTYLSFLRKTYTVLQKQYQNEYILKNELLNNWVKKELGEEESIVFNELNIGKARADLAMFNGVSKVFEIKTIFDDTTRLQHQLEHYKKVFNEVYVVVPFEKLESYIDFDTEIGVITYNANKKLFSLEKKAMFSTEIDAKVLMEVLHTKEYLKICRSYYNNLPEMNAFNQFDICSELISKIPNAVLNNFFLKVMKKREVHNVFFNIVNNEFNQVCLALNLNHSERNNLIENLRKIID